MTGPFLTQLRSDSCVAACCAMLVHRREPPAGEDLAATHERLDRTCRHAGITLLPALEDAARSVGAEFCAWEPDDAGFAALEGLVGLTWCAVLVYGGPWTHSLRQHRKLGSPPHGILSATPTSSTPRHAVVLTEWGPTRLAVHDPWYDWLDQPIWIEPAWLRRAWTGELAYFPP
jgi:hypothetical protein